MSYEELSREQLVEVVKQLENEVKEKENEADKWENKAKKVKADFENYKKKEGERKSKWKAQAQEKLAEDLIEVMDNLERAIASANQDSGIVQGVKMVADQLYESLEKKGLQRIDAEGEEFDPKIHKAVETVEHDENNKVLEEKRKGYMFGEKVLRESEVKIGKKDEG